MLTLEALRTFTCGLDGATLGHSVSIALGAKGGLDVNL